MHLYILQCRFSNGQQGHWGIWVYRGLVRSSVIGTGGNSGSWTDLHWAASLVVICSGNKYHSNWNTYLWTVTRLRLSTQCQSGITPEAALAGYWSIYSVSSQFPLQQVCTNKEEAGGGGGSEAGEDGGWWRKSESTPGQDAAVNFRLTNNMGNKPRCSSHNIVNSSQLTGQNGLLFPLKHHW